MKTGNQKIMISETVQEDRILKGNFRRTELFILIPAKAFMSPETD